MLITAKKPEKAESNSSDPEEDDDYALATEPSKTITSLGEAKLFIYGRKKIGKTIVASKFSKPYFLMTEPGAGGISIYKSDITTWKQFQGVVNSLVKTKEFKTVVIDTLDNAYDYCMDWVCKRNGWTHPADAGYGKGWKAVKSEFAKQINRIIASGKGVIFTSHAKDAEFQSRTGGLYHKVTFTASGQAGEFASGIADVIIYFGYYDDERMMTINGDEDLEAGNRLEKHFIAKNGRDVHSVPMGKNGDEAYKNLVDAFNNKQATSGKPKVTTHLPDEKKKFDVKRRN